MIERHVFIKLKPEHASDAQLAEIKNRSMRLSLVPGVRAVVVGLPADAGARAAWDLCLTVRFDTIAAIDPYLEHPEHRAYYEGFLEARAQVVKAWNFQV